MKKLIALMLVLVLSLSLAACGGEKMQVKENLTELYEIDAEFEKSIINDVTELKELVENAKTDEEMLEAATAITEFYVEFVDEFSDNLEIGREKAETAGTDEFKEQAWNAVLEYPASEHSAYLTLSAFDKDKSAESYFEEAAGYLNEFVEWMFEGYEESVFVSLE